MLPELLEVCMLLQCLLHRLATLQSACLQLLQSCSVQPRQLDRPCRSSGGQSRRKQILQQILSQ